MSSLFQTYLELGFKHISDITAYDHILFIVALCAIYKISEWRKVLILVTAFTIGHSITLALAVFGMISFPQKTIELLIPVTIFVTCLYNILRAKSQKSDSIFNKNLNINYFFAMFFGLIHGMGFSNFLKAMLMPGEETQLVKQLFAFNIGIELGQLLIVAIILVISFVALNLIKIKQNYWNIGLSTIVGLMAVKLFVEQL
jgi:HupE / UreJ protein